MATHFDISNVEDDSGTYARSCHIRLGSGQLSFDAPFKVGNGDATDVPLYEVYRRISPTTIVKSFQSEKYSRGVDANLKNRCKGRSNILIMEYDSKDVIPTSRMVEYLSDIQYNHTDVIVTPSWFSLITRTDSTDVDLFLAMTDEYLEAASRLNHKPMMVSIPQSIPSERIDDVLEHYISCKDVTSFCIDSNSRALMNGSWMRKFQTSIDKVRSLYNIEDECLLYSVNAYQGIVKRNEERIDAKDFLGFTAGIDVIGGKHTKGYNSNDSDERMTVARMFDPETYTYVKAVCAKEVKGRITSQSVAAQIMEMPIIQDRIKEGLLEDHLRSKAISESTLRTIYGLKDTASSIRTLDSFI